MADWEPVLRKLEQILDRAEKILPLPPQAPDWTASMAYRWRRRATAINTLLTVYTEANPGGRARSRPAVADLMMRNVLQPSAEPFVPDRDGRTA